MPRFSCELLIEIIFEGYDFGKHELAVLRAFFIVTRAHELERFTEFFQKKSELLGKRGGFLNAVGLFNVADVQHSRNKHLADHFPFQ